MPNWCYGNLSITASDELFKKILDTVHGDEDDKVNLFDFNKVIPVPEDGAEDTIEDTLHWCNNNWGTKWNSCDTELVGNGFSFYTAWSPCSPVIRALAKMFPDARFEYWYEEPGEQFCGHEIYEHGQAQYLMEADFEEHYNDYDDDPLFEDYKEGREDETITIFDIIKGVKRGRIERREDRDDCIRILWGFSPFILCVHREAMMFSARSANGVFSSEYGSGGYGTGLRGRI